MYSLATYAQLRTAIASGRSRRRRLDEAFAVLDGEADIH